MIHPQPNAILRLLCEPARRPPPNDIPPVIVRTQPLRWLRVPTAGATRMARTHVPGAWRVVRRTGPQRADG
jgi:hypothetical protein